MFAGLFVVMGTAVIVVIVAVAKGGATIAVSSSTAVSAAPGPGPPGSFTITPLSKAPGLRLTRNPATHFLVDQHNQDVGHVVEAAWIVLVITAFGAGVLGWFVAGRVLTPLREMASTARTITAGNLHERLALDGPNDEFKQLGDAFDELLGRLEAAFEGQRRFVANASHELRTPLTVERTLLQVALANPNADEESLRAACEELLASQVDHERLLEGLLTLASSERGLDHHEPIDLAALACDQLESAADAVAARSLCLERELEPAPSVGDAVLVGRLIGNLIDNAIDHNVDSGWLSVRTDVQDGCAVISVANGGYPIEASEVSRLFEPFQRLDGRAGSSNGNGNGNGTGNAHHGLGLSIVRAIATIHGGEVSAEAHPGGGLAVTVRLQVTAEETSGVA